MASIDFATALDSTSEIDLTTTGRVTGKLSSRPVWFVKREGKVYLLSVTGSDTQWYKNVVKTPAIRLTAGDAEYAATATPITDPDAVAQVVDAFRAKYGARDVASYYPRPDTAVEVPLAGGQA